MSHINFDKQGNKKRSWKGFYLALAICLVAVGGVAVTTFMNSGLQKSKDPNTTSSVTTPTTSPTKPVDQIITNIPDDRTTTEPTQETTENKTTTTQGPADLFILPLTNEVQKEFSKGQPVFSATMNDWRIHNGVDFKGTANQTVKALADGTIVSISSDVLWGDVVVIDHGYGIQSKYCGLKTSNLKEKQAVKVGQKLGTLSEIPCESADGPHLHLEITVKNEYVNPIEAIGKDIKLSSANE